MLITKTAMSTVGAALLALTSALLLASVEAAGVCYSPFHAEKYFSKPAEIEQVLLADMQQIASDTGFSAVRTYHAQFYGQNVINAVVANKLQVAIGIQMVGVNGASYSYLEDDIQAAISAATEYPESVLAIYAGNENLKNGDFGSSSADDIIAVISKVKSALKGTKGANVPVGTVQRLEEWLHATDADRVAAASDVVGVNIYPFFTKGGEADMIGALDAQWTQIVSKVGASKARLTETGWPSQGSRSDAGNDPTLANAQKYFAAFSQWAAAKHAATSPFYFMMYDLLSAHATDYEQHFGVATASGELKFSLGSSSATSTASQSTGSTSQSNGLIGASTEPSAGSAGAFNGASPSASNGSSGPLTSQSVGSSAAGGAAASFDEVAGEADRSADSLPTSFSFSTTSSISSSTSTSSFSSTTVTPSPSPTVVVSSAIGSATSSGVNSVSSTTNVVSSVTAVPSVSASASASAGSASSSGSSNFGSSASKAPKTKPLPSLDDAGVVSSSSLSGSGFGNQEDVGFGSSSFSGSVGSSSSGLSKPVNNDPDVGDVDSNAPVAAPDLTPQTFAPVPSTSSSSSSASKAKELETQEAQAKQARDVSGGQGTAFTGIAAGVGFAGVAVIAVIAVYVQKRRNESENQISITTADARDSTPSVYSDPLGTRFSSIVMITPNGDGVCIL